jgi:orotidine-5'-phosphate decarboxylase
MASDAGNQQARARLVLALDVSSLDEAVGLAKRLEPWFGVVKVGLELFSAEGPLAVDALLDEGFQVFVDLKLHDIPTTVARAARRLGSLGVVYATVHGAGGEDMCRAAVEGFEEGWATAVANGHPEPPVGATGILAVTVLTSDPHADAETVASRALLAARAGCLGAVCAAADLPVVCSRVPGILTVIPAIRLGGSSSDDQGRPAGPSAAIRAGADLLVIGRTVTGAENPEGAAAQLTDEVGAALATDPAGGDR